MGCVTNTETLTAALLSSAANSIARLPALASDHHWPHRWLRHAPHVVSAVRAKHMTALEATLRRLRDTVRAPVLGCCLPVQHRFG